jgi:hypothetical protein
VRLLQNILLVLGATALGAVVCGGLACLPVLLVFRTRPGQDPSLNWGAGIAFTVCGLGAGIVGAVIGFVGATRWIALGGRDPWTLMAWIGIALGLAAALATRFSLVPDRLGICGELIESWPGLGIFLAAAGTLGGLIGGISGARWERQDTRGGKRRFRDVSD